MTEPRLTFAIPYYRHPRMLRRALASLLEQTEPNFRVIVIDDDGPDPGAAEVVARFGDARFHYERNPKSLGIAGNWNRCVERVTTPLFTILHGDDEVEPDYARTMLAAHDRHPDAAAVYCRTRIIGSDSRPKFSFPDEIKRFIDGQGQADKVLAGEDGVTRLMKGCFIFCPTLCYRKAALTGDAFDERWRQVLDLEFYIRLLAKGGRLVGIADRAYRYRRHDGNQTAALTANLERFREEFALHRTIEGAMRERGWDKAAAAARAAPLIRMHLVYLAARDALNGRMVQARSKLRFLRDERRADAR